MKKHGVTINVERIGEDIFLILKAYGTLTHGDYEIITPTIDEALDGVQGEHVRALFDMEQFEGWELRAAWDDMKIGLKHGNQFKKIALYGHKKWQEIAAKIGALFTSGEVQYFENYEKAMEWVRG